jgi:hypothetical protein
MGRTHVSRTAVIRDILVDAFGLSPGSLQPGSKSSRRHDGQQQIDLRIPRVELSVRSASSDHTKDTGLIPFRNTIIILAHLVSSDSREEICCRTAYLNSSSARRAGENGDTNCHDASVCERSAADCPDQALPIYARPGLVFGGSRADGRFRGDHHSASALKSSSRGAGRRRDIFRCLGGCQYARAALTS